MNLSQFKPCIDWCVQSNTQYEMQLIPLLIAAAVLCISIIIFNHYNNQSMINITATIIGILILMFVLMNITQSQKSINEQMDDYIKRIPANAPLVEYGETINPEDNFQYQNELEYPQDEDNNSR